METSNLQNTEQVGINLYKDICQIIEKTRGRMSSSVNMELTLMYWNIGDRINHDILGLERAAYGKQIVATLSRQLTEEYGTGLSDLKLLKFQLQKQLAIGRKRIEDKLSKNKFVSNEIIRIFAA